MSFLAESLSNPVVLTGGDFDGQGGEKTNGGENTRSLIDLELTSVAYYYDLSVSCRC